MKPVTYAILLLLSVCAGVAAQTSSLRTAGGVSSLYIGDEPFLVLGGELGNSSATCEEDIARIFPRLRRMGLNTVLVPAYWDLTEPEEGVFDFTLTDCVIRCARENNLRVVFLWFGVWKNSMSCYAPEWFKADYTRFPRAETSTGKPLEIASVFSEDVFEADNKAFGAWLEHIADVDREAGTVIMIQVENEIGMLEEARDYSPAANELFASDVPDALVSYLEAHKDAGLHPWLSARWAARGYPSKGTWSELFGDDIYTGEIFMAWHYASYVGRLARTAKSICAVPLYVNAAMNSRGRQPGEYPSAGPLAHLIDLWRAGAPDISFIAPDLYDDGFTSWAAQYALPGNPLFIPEIRLAENDGVRAMYAFGEHGAIGFSPFSIEDAPDDGTFPLTPAYGLLEQLSPLIARCRATDAMHGLLFDERTKERVITDGDLTITCRHYFTLPWDSRATDGSVWPEGGGLIIRIARNEYIIAGSGVVAEFAKTTEKDTPGGGKTLGEDGFALSDGGQNPASGTIKPFSGLRAGIASVGQININPDGSFKRVRSENGDQTHQGRHVRIPAGEFRILHVKLYEYQ
ncbi:MAG: DUF5597 domain-containing protein [Prevotella sp.]|nr:DUF5597 domain-containing protein [Prevotella sp.]